MEAILSNDGDEQVELYFASIHSMRITNAGYEPLWQLVPAPHTRCGDTDRARSTVAALKKHDHKFSLAMFKAVRIRDNAEMFNESIP